MKIKLKDFSCKWEVIEFKLDTEKGFVRLGKHNLEDLKRSKYKDYYVYSYKYFEDTKTTSVIVGKEPLYDCEEDTTPHLSKIEIDEIMNILKQKNKEIEEEIKKGA